MATWKEDKEGIYLVRDKEDTNLYRVYEWCRAYGLNSVLGYYNHNIRINNEYFRNKE